MARQFERRHITSVDLGEWPRITQAGAGSLDGATARLSSHAETRMGQDKWPYLVFSNPSGEDSAEHAFAISKDGRLLASTWDSDVIMIWRLSDGFNVQRIATDPAATILALAFSPDGKQISGALDAVVVVWDVKSSDPLLRLEGHSEPVNAIAYAPDGSRIVTGAEDGLMKIWNASSGEPSLNYHHDSPVQNIQFSPDGSRLAAQTSSSVVVYNPGSPVIQLAVLWSAKDCLCAFSPKGDRLFVNDGNRVGHIYDAHSFEKLVKIDKYHDHISSAAFTPDGRRLATASHDAFAIVQNASTGTQSSMTSMETGINAITFSPDGNLLAAADREGKIRVWMGRSMKFVAEFRGPNATDTSVIQFLPDNRRLLTADETGAICLWDVGNVLRIR
ncbi:uncharacterized protein PHACADRAFT_248936 [Phanerochaete carnosa HHB-10118-sp]|uniref:Uncharacterized protein n=1 Tax=Phanerochaete carnosa (strain HHB-10118-sp) TaxID=650164 RepID=K5WHN7_PHACS|nr:uncharacterized protein PHACADRAFT_248936 [Phanerochaete carnosa HHB-10118-sp]EKM58840.1 hypothetical protein PHACADRAFT_248936 [Phanerochaete carnosa HHB-10118-sp]